MIEELLRQNAIRISEFENEPDSGLLVLRLPLVKHIRQGGDLVQFDALRAVTSAFFGSNLWDALGGRNREGRTRITLGALFACLAQESPRLSNLECYSTVDTLFWNPAI